VLNNLGNKIDVEVYKTGNLSEYITLAEPTKFTLLPGEIKTLSFTLALPANLGEPGTHEARIGAIEGAPDISGGGTVLGARAAVEMQIWVNVPYPGKYVKVALEAMDADVGKPVNFSIKITNLGTDTVQVSDEIKIFENDTYIGSVRAQQSIWLDSQESGEMRTAWIGQKAGSYRAVANVSYDGRWAEAETVFRVGQLLVEIVALPKVVVQEGQIAEFTPTVVSRWNSEIKGVYGEIEILKDGDVVARGRSESFDIGPWQTKTFSIFVKTKDLPVGSYDGRLTIYYAGQSASKQFFNILEIRKIEALPVFVIIIVILLILLILLAVLAVRKRYGKKRKKG
jgi:hypothetical protein